MKPAPFEYYAPSSIEEVLFHLAEYGYDAKPLAGGQSLIAMMNFRLAQPAVLVDMNNIPSLSYIRTNGDSGMVIGAMTRHHEVEQSDLVSQYAPLIYETMPKVATPQIRSRGTFGGSIAHADPAAELVAVSLALDCRFKLRSNRGERWVPAKDFFVGMFATLLEPDEILVETEIPAMPARSGWSIQEVARRPHDFAIAGVVAVLSLDKKERCQKVHIVCLSVGDGPVPALEAEKLLIGQVLDSEAIQSAADLAATMDIDPGGDIHASADFRRHLVKVLTIRALDEAYRRAGGKIND